MHDSFLIGLDGIFRFSPGPDSRPAAYRGYWINDQTFYLEYDDISNNDHSIFTYHYIGGQVEESVGETDHDLGAQFMGKLQTP